MISGLVNQLLAQDAAPPSSPDLAGRIDSLEEQLADLKSELLAQKAAAPAPLPAPARAEAAVGYIKYASNDKWYLATRGEWFHDHDGFETGTAQNLGEVTLTLQRMLASKIISRLEYRYDTSDQNVFPYHTADFRGNQNTVTLGLIYAFSNADAK
jgi:hypothetical protein